MIVLEILELFNSCMQPSPIWKLQIQQWSTAVKVNLAFIIFQSFRLKENPKCRFKGMQMCGQHSYSSCSVNSKGMVFTPLHSLTLILSNLVLSFHLSNCSGWRQTTLGLVVCLSSQMLSATWLMLVSLWRWIKIAHSILSSFFTV